MERPDFYILTSDDWKQFIDRYVRSKKPARIDENYCPTWKDGYVRTGVRPAQIAVCKGKMGETNAKAQKLSPSMYTSF